MDLSYLDLLMAQDEEEISDATGGGGIWVIVEHHAQAIAPVSLEALGAARSLADSIGAYVYAVLFGEDLSSLATLIYQAGADGVRIVDDAALVEFAVEPHSRILVDLLEEEKPEVVLLGATEQGNELAPRLAERLGGGLIERATGLALDDATRTVQAEYAMYGGDYFQIAACREGVPQFITIEPGALAEPFLESHRRGDATFLSVLPTSSRVQVDGPADGFALPRVPLAKAPVVVAVGRQASQPSVAQHLAEILGGAFAGDRGAFDAGWIERDQMVDVRGTEVSPELYVAVGIRGDTFHNAAMRNSRFIVAIHPEADAPIFEIADVCAVADPPDLIALVLEELGATS